MSVSQALASRVEGESESLGFDDLTKEKRRLVLGREGAVSKGEM